MLSATQAFAVQRKNQRFNFAFALWVVMLDNGGLADLRSSDKAVLRQIIHNGCRGQNVPVRLDYLVFLLRTLRAELVLCCVGAYRQQRELLILASEPLPDQLLQLFPADFLERSRQCAQSLRQPDLDLEEVFDVAETAQYLLNVRIEHDSAQIPSRQLLDENPDLIAMFKSAMRI